MSMTDQEILAGLRQNDRSTAEYVYKALAPPVFKYVLANNGAREEAKDLFQETFIKVLKKIHDDKYDHREKFEAYFCSIARNSWIDYLRSRKKRPTVNDEGLLLQMADDADEDALFQLILRDRRMTALCMVWEAWEDSECRRILHRFHYDRIRTKDLAQEEGASQNTILQRLFKCRNKLFRLVSYRVEALQRTSDTDLKDILL